MKPRPLLLFLLALLGSITAQAADVTDLSQLNNRRLYAFKDSHGTLRVNGDIVENSGIMLDANHMGLVTNVNQLSSPFTELTEGSLEALLDNNPETFWHSVWTRGDVAAHTHYLQVELTAPVTENIYMQVTRRRTENNHITQWGVFGSNSPTAADDAWMELASISMPYGNQYETCISAPFDTKGYKYLRFYIDDTSGEDKASTHGFGHMSEFRLFKASELPSDAGLESDENSQFAILTINGKYYIYSPVKKAFWLVNGYFLDGFGSPVTFSDENASGEYLWTPLMPFGDNLVSFNPSKEPCRIIPVGNFDPTEALAAFTENVDLGLTDGFYRLRSLFGGSNNRYAYGEKDSEGIIHGMWSTMENPASNVSTLWKLTNRNGYYDLQNAYTHGRFTSINYSELSPESESLLAFDRVASLDNGQPILNIRLASMEMANFNYLHAGNWDKTSGTLTNWYNTGAWGASEWILDPVSAEEANAILSLEVGKTFTAAVPCGNGTANLTFKVTNLQPLEVEITASPENIAGALNIPATVQNEGGIEFAVKSIGNYAFQDRDNLTSVTISEGVNTIGYWAFQLCDNLETVVLPESITDIFGAAFGDCSRLSSIHLPSQITTIYTYTFAGCRNLSSINIPDGVQTILEFAFNNCSSLKSITLPEGLTTINHKAFRGSGLESITFPSTLTYVGTAAFRDCKGLKTIDFNGSSAELDAESFIGVAIEELTIPANIQLNGWTVFGWCEQLKTLTVKTNTLGNNDIFKHCTSLETVEVPSLNVIGVNFFEQCTSLKTVKILSIADDYEVLDKNFARIFRDVSPDQVQFIVPDGTAEKLLRAGYMHLSDKSGLPLVREEFEAEVSRIQAMAAALTGGNKAVLNRSISSARTAVNAAEDYATVYAQIAAVKDAAKTFLSTTTQTKGFDITAAYITNPDFDRFQIGWIVPGGDDHRGWQAMSRGNGGVTIDNFVEAWRNGIVIDDGQIAQTIKNLPAGIYRLECDATAAWTNDENVEAKGIHLFAGSNRKAIATVGYEPQHFSLSFENTTAGDVTIGIRINETNANWVAMDNVRLYYEGEVAAIPQGADLVSDPDARVYLYNVETGKYLSAGHSWRTHAILDETGLPVRLTQDAQTGLWQVYFWEGSQLDRLLFKVYSDYPEDEVCVDYNHDYDKADENLTWWSFTKTGDGSYVIQNKTNLGTDKWLGNVPTRQDYQNGYSGISYTDVICTASQNDNSHWLIFTKDDCDLIAAKYRLMSAILRMEESETVNEDLLTTAQGIYDDDNVTTEEVIAVTTLLNSQMGMPKKDQPVEMTALIINPRFEDNTTEGWTGATVVGGRADATSNHEQEFYEKNFNMYQTITGVPNGLYRVKFKAFHRPGSCEDVYEDYMSGSDKSSAIFYANNVQKALKNWATESGNADLGDWEQYGEYYPNSMEAARRHFDAGHYADYLDVEVTDNVLTIGFRNTQEMTVCQWVVFSDLELYILENADQQNNKLTIADMKCVQGGQATLAVNLKNADAISAFQFDLKLPEGIHVATNTSGKLQASLTNRKIDHSFSSRQLDANTYAFTALSLSSSDFRGNDGAVVNITLTADEDKALGEFAILLKNIELTKPNGLNVLPFDVTAKLTISNLTNGDVNGDGRVSITDAVYIVNYVLRQPASDFHAEAADLNGDGKITITDAVQIVNIILSQGRSVKASELPADWQKKEMMED